MSSREVGTWDAEAEAFDEEPDHGLHDPVVRDAWRGLLRSVVPPIPSRVADLGCGVRRRPVPDPAYWGKRIDDERYLVVGRVVGRRRA